MQISSLTLIIVVYNYVGIKSIQNILKMLSNLLSFLTIKKIDNKPVYDRNLNNIKRLENNYCLYI